MCRAGGPRCDGKGRRSKADTTNTEASGGTATAVADPPSTVPSREDTDRLAASIPANRTDAFGRPLSEADRRFFALRESGWQGPIDQDGYPATSGQGADILRRMAQDRGENPTW